MVAVGLVGVGSGKFGEGCVEFFTFAEIAADLRCVAGAGVCAGQGPAADFEVLQPVAAGHVVQIDFHFHVAELAKIIAAAFFVASPTEEDVARGLQHALAGDDSLAVIEVATLSRVRLEDGGKRFFELEEHGVVLAGHQQSYVAARSYAADSHHFSRDVDNVIAVENHAAIYGKSLAVGVEHLGDLLLHEVALTRVVHEWGMIDDSRAAIYNISDFGKNVLGGLQAGFGLDLLPANFRRDSLGVFDEYFGVHAGIPDFQVAHFGVLADVFAIGLRHGKDGIFAAVNAHAEFTRSEDDAGGEALDVPFPGGLKSFVEIVDVEQKLALGAGKAAEICGVAIAAGLHANSGGGSFGEIPCHHCGRTAEEGERGLAHAAVADGQEFGETAAVG